MIPIFLTLGIGFYIGQLKYKSFSLGPVAATLIVGVIIGQIGIDIPVTVRTVFFMLFLFSIGYSVSPQFFSSLRGRGLKQVGYAVLEAVVCASLSSYSLKSVFWFKFYFVILRRNWFASPRIWHMST